MQGRNHSPLGSWAQRSESSRAPGAFHEKRTGQVPSRILKEKEPCVLHHLVGAELWVLAEQGAVKPETKVQILPLPRLSCAPSG